MQRMIALSLLLWLPASALGQSNPYGSPSNPAADARARRALRERAVARVGPVARALVEAYGAEAVAALSACSPATGRKLAEFHDAGGFENFPRPHDLLVVIARPGHGDDVCHWAMQHAKELQDLDQFNAYLFTPMDYALGLKSLAQGAAEARARRLEARAPQAAPPGATAWSPADWQQTAAGVGAVAILVLAGWWIGARRASR